MMEPTASILRAKNGSKILLYSYLSTNHYTLSENNKLFLPSILNHNLITKNLSIILPYKVVEISTIFDLSWLVLPNPTNEEILRELGLLTLGNDPHFILSKLLLHPNHELSKVIWGIATLNDFSHCIGIQLRMGGSIAKTHEMITFLNISSVERELPKIDQRHRNISSVFLSYYL